MRKNYDFSGWATKYGVKCADGRTIQRGAFADHEGKTVPLVWNHQHGDPEMVLGHAILECKEDGVYAYGFLNNSKKSEHVRETLKHSDVTALSIYANRLKQNGENVMHGVIRELSIVLAGANPEAFIEDAMMAHGDLFEDGVLVAICDDEVLNHKDKDENEAKTEKKEDDDKQKETETKEKKDNEGGDKTVGNVLNTLNEEQKLAVGMLLKSIEDDADTDGDGETIDEDKEDDADMKHNVFDTNTAPNQAVLSHSDMETIFRDWKRFGSFKDTLIHHMEEGGVLAHAVYNHNPDGTQGSEQTYGIADIDYLFPDARTINDTPDFISRQMDWVRKVMNGVRHTPFSRVKSVHANITMEEARARGYVKGNKKAEEVFALLKRVTTPQTIYKKQKLDRDDIIDIVDLNVVAWIKQEMRLMLEEECARAMLIGDGRSVASPDHISEEHIRPIWKDDPLYTVRVNVPAGSDDAATAKNFINQTIRSRKLYKGSGNTTLFTTADWHTEMLLLEDGIGHPLYDTDEKLRTKLRVNDIVEVEPMEGQEYDGKELMGIIVDLKDYNVGADKGGQTTTFEDFDIDYNQEKYLMETRFSGALVKPYSAIVLEKAASSSGGAGSDDDNG